MERTTTIIRCPAIVDKLGRIQKDCKQICSDISFLNLHKVIKHSLIIV